MDEAAKMFRVHIIVSGRVQGVFFRVFTRERAEALGITGFVRNRGDGKVEIVAEGSPAKIKAFIHEVGKGPPLSVVDKINVKYEKFTGEYPDFKIVY